MNWFRKRNKFENSNLIITEAFTCGGVTYYQADNLMNLPYQRGLTALTVYEELRMKCTYEFLKAHCQAVKAKLEAPKFDMKSAHELHALNEQLLQRLTWISDTEIVYKLAAVVYFDKTESPLKYEADYAAKKIKHWKKHSSVEDFFLQKPLCELLPFLKELEGNFQSYSQTATAVTKLNWEKIYQQLSPSLKTDYSKHSVPGYLTETGQN